MKKILYSLILLVTIGVMLPYCSKEISNRTDNAPALNPSKTDLNAGTWKTILLTGPTEFAVAAPAATTTPDYIAQVNEIKTWQASLTEAEKKTVVLERWCCVEME